MTSGPVMPVAAFDVAVSALRDPRAVVLIDGRSGAGKSLFAGALARSTGARLLRLDDVYPGWHGLDAAARTLVDRVLTPRRAGAAGRWAGWDWPAGHAVETRVLPPDGPLVVEGCGALTRASAPFASLGLWLELGAEERRRRALARDGDVYRPYWRIWATQEDRLIAREHPRALADLLVDGRSLPDALSASWSSSARPADAQ